MKAIFNRRSIRNYTSQPIEDEIITELVKAGLSAPSAGNEQPWHFICIRSHVLIDGILAVHPYANALSGAQATILVCGDLSREVYKGFWMLDCAAATENILIAATAKGLGTVWLGVYPIEERVNGIRELFRMPSTIVPFSLIPIGHPKEKKKPHTDFDMSRLKFDKW